MSLNFKYSDFPQNKYRLADNYNALNNNGVFYLFIPILIGYMAFVTELLR